MFLLEGEVEGVDGGGVGSTVGGIGAHGCGAVLAGDDEGVCAPRELCRSIVWVGFRYKAEG